MDTPALPRSACAALLALSATLSTAGAAAAGSRPAELFERAAAAEDRGDHATAARLFAEADAIAPNDVALTAALEAAVAADDPGFAMDLAARVETRDPDEALETAANDARTRLAARAGRVQLHCRGCTATIDEGSPYPLDLAPGHARWLTAGVHHVDIVSAAGDTVHRTVKVKPSGTARIALEDEGARAKPAATPVTHAALASPTQRTPADDAPGGISPAWFWTGAGLTAVAAGFTIASGVDTLKKHDEFKQTGDEAIGRAGMAADARTQVLAGATVALATGTTLLGLIAVQWSTPAATVTGGLAAAKDGLTGAVRGTF